MVAHFTSLLSAVKVLGERIAALHSVLADIHAGARSLLQATSSKCVWLMRQPVCRQATV